MRDCFHVIVSRSARNRTIIFNSDSKAKLCKSDCYELISYYKSELWFFFLSSHSFSLYTYSLFSVSWEEEKTEREKKKRGKKIKITVIPYNSITVQKNHININWRILRNKDLIQQPYVRVDILVYVFRRRFVAFDTGGLRIISGFLFFREKLQENCRALKKYQCLELCARAHLSVMNVRILMNFRCCRPQNEHIRPPTIFL